MAVVMGENMLMRIWRMFINSPSVGVALAKVLVPLFGVLVLILLAMLGYADALPEKYRWILRLFLIDK